MWKLTKWGVKIVGGMTSETIDFGGWMGGTCAEFFKHGRYQALNQTNEDLSDRETNLRLIQLADSYQDASVGGHVTRTVSDLITKEDKLRVLLDSGIDWALGEIKQKGVEILLSSGLTQITLEKLQIKKGLKNPVGLNIVFHYLVLTRKETSSEVKQWAKGIIDLATLYLQEVTNEVEVIIKTLKIHEENISCMSRSRDLVDAERKLIWQMNEENVGLYIETESNWDKHCEANNLVNSCLRKLRGNGGGSSGLSELEARVELEKEGYLPFLNRLRRSLPEYERDSKHKEKMERILIMCIDSVEEKQQQRQRRQEMLLQQERARQEREREQERVRQQEQERADREFQQELRELERQRRQYSKNFSYQTQPRFR